MQNIVRNAIQENHMLSRGDRCIIGVSGGADSMGLLHALIRLNGVFKVNYRVVHVHHGLRGAEADRDANFVRSTCARYNIPCKVIEVNVLEFAAKHKLSIEEAARYLRYQAFETEAQRWEMEEDTMKQVKIAVAHNKEDNAETIIMQLSRGSGLKGVSGMAAVRGRIIRPLLEVSRSQIEAYLIKEEESWINDSTNAERDYTRNRIRHDILPLLINEVKSGAVDNITRAAKMVGQADQYITKTAEKLLDSFVRRRGAGYEIPVDEFLKQDGIIQNYVIKLLIGMVNRSMKNITSHHIEDVVGLAASETGKHIDLPYRLVAERDYETIRVYRKEAGGADEGEDEPVNYGRFIFRTFPYRGQKAPEGKYTKWFDYDKIDDLMDIRYRQSGDMIELRGVGTKALRTFMTDAKIPQEKRDSIPLIAAGQHVMWLVGYRISEKYKVEKGTEIVLEITYEEGE